MKKWIDYIWAGCWVLIVNDNHDVLLLLRTNKSSSWGEWLWTRPWWWIEFWETITEAFKREALEEIWVEIELFWPILFIDDIRKENWKKMHWVSWWTFGRIIEWKEINMEPDKHKKMEWFNINNLPENIAEYTMHWIEEYKKYILN